jgi:hypothetical protein
MHEGCFASLPFPSGCFAHKPSRPAQVLLLHQLYWQLIRALLNADRLVAAAAAAGL